MCDITEIPAEGVKLELDVLSDPDFKEDSVREEFVHPLLVRLGYASTGEYKIIRSKSLLHPFLQVGTRKLPVTLIPDYVLSAPDRYVAVVDAKAPKETITSGQHVEQAYSYAVHPEIRAPYFALCNGRRFAVFETAAFELKLVIDLSDLDEHWPALNRLIGASSIRKKNTPSTASSADNPVTQDYLGIQQPREIVKFQKQAAKRHHGVHGYFTRQVWSVVQHYIATFSRPGDTVLDPFGGSGVTLLESLIIGRRAIHVDLNPLSTFIVGTMVKPVDLGRLQANFEIISREFEKQRPAAMLKSRRASIGCRILGSWGCRRVPTSNISTSSLPHSI